VPTLGCYALDPHSLPKAAQLQASTNFIAAGSGSIPPSSRSSAQGKTTTRRAHLDVVRFPQIKELGPQPDGAILRHRRYRRGPGPISDTHLRPAPNRMHDHRHHRRRSRHAAETLGSPTTSIPLRMTRFGRADPNQPSLPAPRQILCRHRRTSRRWQFAGALRLRRRSIQLVGRGDHATAWWRWEPPGARPIVPIDPKTQE